jgi:hypothetical protein
VKGWVWSIRVAFSSEVDSMPVAPIDASALKRDFRFFAFGIKVIDAGKVTSQQFCQGRALRLYQSMEVGEAAMRCMPLA